MKYKISKVIYSCCLIIAMSANLMGFNRMVQAAEVDGNWQETQRIDSLGMDVTFSSGSFDQEVDLSLQALSSQQVYPLVQSINPSILSADSLVAFSIDFSHEQTHFIQPSSTMNLQMTTSQLDPSLEWHVYGIQAMSQIQELPIIARSGSTISVQASQFDTIVLAANPPVEKDSETAPKTRVRREVGEETETNPPEKTDAFGANLSLVGSTNQFYGGQIITVYNNVSVSGNQTILEEGAHTIISVPKNAFTRPIEADISTAFDNYSHYDIRETDTDYQVVIYYKTLYGGYNAGTPVKFSLKPSQVVNLQIHPITQVFYDKDGQALTQPSVVNIQSRAIIETLYNTTQTHKWTKQYFDENYHLNSDAVVSVQPGKYYLSNDDSRNDPRDRRWYATIPEGYHVADDSGWTLESETGRYYIDASRETYGYYYPPSIKISLEGHDMTEHDTYEKAETFTVKFEVAPVVDGVVADDLHSVGRTTVYSYIEKQAPRPSGTGTSYYSSLSTYLIDSDYQRMSDDTYEKNYNKSITISYNKDYLHYRRVKYVYNNLIFYYTNAPENDRETRTLTIKSARVNTGKHIDVQQLRLMVHSNMNADLVSQLQGTKAYGITRNGQKVLLSDNVPIVTKDDAGFDNESLQDVDTPNEYVAVEFEYPNEGIHAVGDEQIASLSGHLKADVIGRVKDSTYETLKEKLDNHENPYVSDDNRGGRTNFKVSYLRYADDETRQESDLSTSDSGTYINVRMQMETLDNYSSVHLTSGSYYFLSDVVSTELAYRQNRYGNFSPSTNPKNLWVYYLVPDGLEPKPSDDYSEIDILHGYRTIDNRKYNLVMAKPTVSTIPTNNQSIYDSAVNYKRLSFDTTNRLEDGTYTIYSAVVNDNNKIGIDKRGNQYGILTSDSIYGVWSDLIASGKNRPDAPTTFVDLGSSSFTLYPPRVLTTFKEVKLSSEDDSRYASSLGAKASIGDKIDYRLNFRNNSPKDVTNLQVIDVLPYVGDHAIVANQNGEYPPRGSAFSTPLISVEENDKFTFYYSTDPVQLTTEENMNATWTKTPSDPSQVTMIKAVLKEGQSIASGESFGIVTHHFIENNPRIPDSVKAYNSFAYTLNEGNSYLEALRVEVAVNYPKHDVLVKKIAKSGEGVLDGAHFSVIDKETDTVVLTDVVTNHDGLATLPNLFVGREYILKEIQAPDGYEIGQEDTEFTVTGEEQLLTIKNDVPRKDIQVTKKWIGAINPTEIKVVLVANGEKTNQSLILNEKNHWQGTFKDVAMNDYAGLPIRYEIEEEEVVGYQTLIEGSVQDGYTITNVNVSTINIPVKKIWKGPAKDKIVIHLYRDGQELNQSMTLSEDNDWQATFFEMLQYDPTDGHAYQYTIKEEAIEGYTSQVEEKDQGFVLTNVISQKRDLSITKKWQGKQGKIALVDVFANDQKIRTVKLSEQNHWTVTLSDVDQYDDKGQEIVYHVNEHPQEGYRSIVTGSLLEGFIVTNVETGVHTGMDVPMMSLFILMATSLVGLIWFNKKQRRS